MLDRLLERAAVCCRDERCEEAVGLLEEAVRLQPGNPGLHYRLGVCQSGGCRKHGGANPEMAAAWLRHGLELAAGAGLRAHILDALGNLHARAGRPQEAVECHGGAAEIYESRGEMEDWARTQFNLGNACCELEKWSEAIAHFERALAVRTRAADPRRYAATLENVGTAWRQAGDIPKAIACFHGALRVYTAAAFPERNAGLHNNIGNAYLSLDGERNARRALRHLDHALAVRTRRRSEADYAVTQFNRGHAYLRLNAMERAADCFREAWECFVATGQTNHAGMALRQLERIGAACLPVAV